MSTTQPAIDTAPHFITVSFTRGSQSKFRLAAAALLLLLTATPSAWALSIDEFGEETPVTTTATTIDGPTLGGERDVGQLTNSSFGATGGQATVMFLSGLSIASLDYDGDDNSTTLTFGLGGLDLTSGGADRFLLSVTGVTGGPSVSVQVNDSIGNLNRTGPLLVSLGLMEIPFSSLTISTGTGASVTSANAVRLVFSNNVATTGLGSATVDYFRTNSSSSSVPEPSSVALMGLGLAALLVSRRQGR